MNIELNDVNKVNKDLVPTLLKVYANNKVMSLKSKLHQIGGKILVNQINNSLLLTLSLPKYMQKTSVYIKNDVSSTVKDIENVLNSFELKVMFECLSK